VGKGIKGLEIKDYKESKRDLELLMNKIQDMYGAVDLPSLKKQLSELESESMNEEFWKDKDRVAVVNQKVSAMRKKIDPWERLMKTARDNLDLMELALEEEDGEMLKDTASSIDKIRGEFERLESLELLSGDDDGKSAYLTIHPGAGGTESQDWANMLFRMYYRWSENKNLSIDVIDYTPGEEAGIKTATLFIKGDFAYGLLKGERGIHRLVRISPFDSNKRRHTSFASVEVIPEIADEIDIQINEADLRIDTYRASGAGGQHVNKTDSAVRITHLPTGIVVQCQNERSQHKNKAFAMKVLKSRMYDLHKKDQDEKQMEKIGEKKDISWGNQIRSYVFQPYTLVKDHRTGEETGSVDYVFDGDLDRFIHAYLKMNIVKA